MHLVVRNKNCINYSSLLATVRSTFGFKKATKLHEILIMKDISSRIIEEKSMFKENLRTAACDSSFNIWFAPNLLQQGKYKNYKKETNL